MSTPDPVFHAAFNPLIKPFLVIKIGLAMACTIVGIPFAILWFLGVGPWWARHYFDRLECHLSDRTLRYRKGILVTTEKTIPLENIQDVTFVEGPILRRFQLSTLKFDTAGHSAGQASDMQLTGIIDAQQLRNHIMAAREAIKLAQRGGGAVPDADGQAAQLAALRAIAAKLDDIAGLLRERR
ncbi:MAG: PH domain-containing protein [Pseudomonadota bacterium]|nr:PH domain-containing protein [Pseudomonadota bacterium]